MARHRKKILHTASLWKTHTTETFLIPSVGLYYKTRGAALDFVAGTMNLEIDIHRLQQLGGKTVF